MLTEPEFDAVIAGFYAAATGDIGWDEALRPVNAAFRARAAVMQSVDLGTGSIVQHSHAGDAMPEAFLAYIRRWHPLDLRRNLILANPQACVGRWWHCHEHVPEDAIGQDRFYQDFLPAQKTRYLATSLHQPAADTLTAFALELPAARGPLTMDERHLAQRLSRHFDDALRAHERIRRLAARVLAGHAVLDLFAHPMWLLDGDRVILHQNPAAVAFASQGQSASVEGRRLHWHGAQINNMLRDVLHALGSRFRHGHRSVIDARASRSDPPCWLHLHVLEPGRVLGGVLGTRLMLLLTLFDARHMSELDPFALSEMFGMTPAEGQVAALLGEGLGARAIAARLGCQESTVRSHIRRVLHKLGAARVADAIRLLRQGEVLWSMPSVRG